MLSRLSDLGVPGLWGCCSLAAWAYGPHSVVMDGEPRSAPIIHSWVLYLIDRLKRELKGLEVIEKEEAVLFTGGIAE